MGFKQFVLNTLGIKDKPTREALQNIVKQSKDIANELQSLKQEIENMKTYIPSIRTDELIIGNNRITRDYFDLGNEYTRIANIQEVVGIDTETIEVNNLTVNKTCTIKPQLNAKGNVSVGGNISVSGNITAGGVSAAYFNTPNGGLIVLDPEKYYTVQGYQEGGDCILYTIKGEKVITMGAAALSVVSARYLTTSYYSDNYISDTYQLATNEEIVFKGGFFLGTMHRTPLLVSTSPPPTADVKFVKEADGTIVPSQSLISNVPTHYARLGVNETMRADMSWSNSTDVRYIPLKLEPGDVYDIDVYLLSGSIVNELVLAFMYDSDQYNTISQYFILDPNNGLMRNWARTTTLTRFGYVSHFVGDGGSAPTKFSGTIAIISKVYIGDNPYVLIHYSGQSAVKPWQKQFINLFGYVNALSPLAVRPSQPSTATLKFEITRRK